MGGGEADPVTMTAPGDDSTTAGFRLSLESVRVAAWGALATAVLAVLIVVGSRHLAHFVAALVAYTFSVLFATLGLTYRYSM